MSNVVKIRIYADPAKPDPTLSLPDVPWYRVKCIGVWDTVGSYGVPAGFGLAPLARYIALISLGFHDKSFGDHVEFGLHAVAIDERRRPFVATFWTIRKGQSPNGHVEQSWFAGEHGNIGGGEPDCGLENEALIWMIDALAAELTGPPHFFHARMRTTNEYPNDQR
jgi:Uncharacterized alpha/beta hydrolase domain (DUF2235)